MVVTSQGQQFPAKLGSSSKGNFGAVQLPAEQYGCVPQTGAGYWSDLMAGNLDVCDLKVNDVLPVKTGAVNGPTSDLAQRIGSDTHSFLDVVQPDPNGGFSKLLDPSCPRLVVMPIVVNNNTGLSNWPNGSGTDVRIVAFALVYIVDWNTPSPGGSLKGAASPLISIFHPLCGETAMSFLDTIPSRFSSHGTSCSVAAADAIFRHGSSSTSRRPPRARYSSSAWISSGCRSDCALPIPSPLITMAS
jgi:hypothetical protein